MIGKDELDALRLTRGGDPVIGRLLDEIQSLSGFLHEADSLIDSLREETIYLHNVMVGQQEAHLNELTAQATECPDALEEALDLIERTVLFDLWENGVLGAFDNYEVDSFEEMLGIIRDESQYPTHAQYGGEGEVEAVTTYRRIRRALP